MGVAQVPVNLLNLFKLNQREFLVLTNLLQLRKGKFSHYVYIHAGVNMYAVGLNHFRIWLCTKPRPSFRL